MDKDTLNMRLQEIEKAIEQAMANINMLLGGKQELKYWLSKLPVDNNETVSAE